MVEFLNFSFSECPQIVFSLLILSIFLGVEHFIYFLQLFCFCVWQWIPIDLWPGTVQGVSGGEGRATFRVGTVTQGACPVLA